MRSFLGGLVALVHCSSSPTVAPDAGNSAPGPVDAAPPKSRLEGAQRGDPELGSTYQLAFSPDGVLFVADGVKSRVVAIETNEKAEDTAFSPIANFPNKVVEAMGGGGNANDVVVTDFAVHPTSKRLYVAVRRSSTRSWAIVTVQKDGSLALFDTSEVTWAAASYAQGASVVRDMGWAPGHVVLTATKGGWTDSTVITIKNDPFTHDASANVATTRSYHRTHSAWETFAPIDRFAVVDDFIAASFTCAPVVRFGVKELSAGMTQVTGTTPFDLGPGKQLTDIALYDKGGKQYLLVIAQNGFGTDFAARVDRALLDQSAQVNTQAPILFNTDPTPLDPAATHAASFDDAVRIATREGAQIIVLHASGALEIADAP